VIGDTAAEERLKRQDRIAELIAALLLSLPAMRLI
jgi:hypothetical protein